MRALLLMTRIPIPGKTKTRLIGQLNSQQVANLHQCFLKDIARQLSFLSANTDLFVSYGNEGSLEIIKNIFDENFFLFPQQGKTLGEKMAKALSFIFAKGYQRVILIGSDCPQLTNKNIEQAFTKLQTHDIVLGPSFDGGYYLIGMKQFFSQLFLSDILWGSQEVLQKTIQQVKSKKVFFLAKEQDIDTLEDLQRFFKKKKTSNSSKNTLDYICKLWNL